VTVFMQHSIIWLGVQAMFSAPSHFSLKGYSKELGLNRLHGGSLGGGGSSFTEDPVRYVRVSRYGHGGPFPSEENLVRGGGGLYTGDFER
jgi:hypothetical protein